jgi:iron complex outermembrane receptor protein
MASKTFKVTAVSAGIGMALGTAPPVIAQEDAVEEIVVTGSHIRRSGFEGRAPIQIMDAEEIAQLGVNQPVEIIKNLTVNSGSQLYNETNNVAGSAMFNLRNLGLGSTLTLLNGRRAGVSPVADATGTDFLDINQFPVAMIERIEFLTDGASATYGSQAVGGVANIITRKGFEGFEISGGGSFSAPARSSSRVVSTFTQPTIRRISRTDPISTGCTIG